MGSYFIKIIRPLMIYTPFGSADGADESDDAEMRRPLRSYAAPALLELIVDS